MNRETLNLIISAVSLFVSVLGAMFYLYGYFRHDKKLKTQQSQINENMLLNAKWYSEMRHSANIVASLQRKDGHRCLIIKNEGLAKAKSVHIELSPDIRDMHSLDPFPQDMESGQSIDVSVAVSIGDTHRNVLVTISWMDDFHKDYQQGKQFKIPLFS